MQTNEILLPSLSPVNTTDNPNNSSQMHSEAVLMEYHDNILHSDVACSPNHNVKKTLQVVQLNISNLKK